LKIKLTKSKTQSDIINHYVIQNQQLYSEFFHLFSVLSEFRDNMIEINNKILTMLNNQDIKDYAGSHGSAVAQRVVDNIYQAYSAKVKELNCVLEIHQARGNQARMFQKIEQIKKADD